MYEHISHHIGMQFVLTVVKAACSSSITGACFIDLSDGSSGTHTIENGKTANFYIGEDKVASIQGKTDSASFSYSFNGSKLKLLTSTGCWFYANCIVSNDLTFVFNEDYEVSKGSQISTHNIDVEYFTQYEHPSL